MAVPVQQQITRAAGGLDGLINASAPAAPATLAREHGAVGQLLMAAEATAAAEPYFRRAAAARPDRAALAVLSRSPRTHAGRCRSCRPTLRGALALRPRDVATLVWLGRVRSIRGGRARRHRIFSRALEQQPDLVAAHDGMGRAALTSGRFADAVDASRSRPSGRHPAASAVHYPLALAYRGSAGPRRPSHTCGCAATCGPDFRIPDGGVAGFLESAVVFEGQGDRALTRGDARAAVAAFRRAGARARAGGHQAEARDCAGRRG